MSNSLEFSINAKDNTSKVVDTVSKKINGFGTDLAKMALGVAGPMALVQAGIGAIGSAIEEYKQKVAEAIKFGAELPNQAKALNLSVEEYQRLTGAAEAAGESVSSVAQAYIEVRKAIEAAKDPTSSQAAALQALGFAAADIAAGVIKPIEVIEKLGRAMSTGADDATQLKIASAFLGTSVEKLIPILRKAKEATEGYTGAGSGLTTGEAGILAEKEGAKAKEENDKKVATARQQARDAIDDDKTGKFGAAKASLGLRLSTEEMTKRFGRGQAGIAEAAKEGYTFEYYRDGKNISGHYEKARRNLSDKERDLIIAEYQRQKDAAKEAEDKAAKDAAAQAAAKLQAIADEAAAKKQKEKENADAAKAKEKADADAAKERQKKDDDAKKAAEDKVKKDKDGTIRYVFETQNNGENTCKSPRGMFLTVEIANDLDFVKKSITEYEN
jgi:hypothetical protein